MGESLGVFNGPLNHPLEHGDSVRFTFAGAESNVALGLTRLGHPSRWLSILGEDPFGRRIFKTLRGEGVDVSRVSWSATLPTAVMFKSRRGHAEPLVYYYRAHSAFSGATEASFAPIAWRDARAVFVTGITPALGDGCLRLVKRVIADARDRGIPVWFDPNYRRKLWSRADARKTLTPLLPLVDVVLAGLHEGEMLTGERRPSRVAAALRKAGPVCVVLKDGECGARAWTKDGEFSAPPFHLRRMVDPIGAGDGFAAGFFAAHLEGKSIEECLRQGNAAGAIVCQTEGDWEGLPTRHELDGFLAASTESDR